MPLSEPFVTLRKERLRPSEMAGTFLPLLAYPVHEHPGMDSSRDEGEQGLRRVRALLRLSAKTPGLECFWSPVIAARCPPPWDLA